MTKILTPAGLADTFEGAFAELGGQVVLAAAVNKGDTEMGPVLDAVAASGAEPAILSCLFARGRLHRPTGEGNGKVGGHHADER